MRRYDEGGSSKVLVSFRNPRKRAVDIKSSWSAPGGYDDITLPASSDISFILSRWMFRVPCAESINAAASAFFVSVRMHPPSDVSRTAAGIADVLVSVSLVFSFCFIAVFKCDTVSGKSFAAMISNTVFQFIIRGSNCSLIAIMSLRS